MDSNNYLSHTNPQLVECVANISEGNNLDIINSIEDSLKSHKKVLHLHTDIGKDANRTVITFCGHPEALISAAFDLVERTALLIDMQQHYGEHPRIGAVDVIPLIPLNNITLKECSLWAKELAEKIGNELKIPVYIYGEGATTNQRRDLPYIRQGNYEGLKKRMEEGFIPDFGPKKFNKETGATAVGARNIMLAYNINLKTDDVTIANKIASKIRTSGEIIKEKRIPGILKSVQAKGWYMNEYKMSQVTTNIHNLDETSMHLLYETVKKEAKKFGIKIHGSELIGIAPLSSLLNAGKFYQSKKFRKSTETTEKELINCAVKKLGLNSVKKFTPDLQIIEYLIR